MLRIILAIAILALTACSAQETATTGTYGTASEAGAAAELPSVGAPRDAAAAYPQVEECLDLIREAAFTRALPLCLEALDLDPQNQELSAAVERARAEVASPTGR